MTYITLAIIVVRILMAWERRGPQTVEPDTEVQSQRRVFHPAEYELRVPEWR